MKNDWAWEKSLWLHGAKPTDKPLRHWEITAQALREAEARGMERAAKITEGFPGTDAFDKLDLCCVCDGAAQAIRDAAKGITK